MPDLKTIRPVEPRDAAPLCALLNEIIEIGGTTAYETPFDLTTIAEKFITGPDLLCCHVAEDDAGAVAGVQFLTTGGSLDPGVCAIATFARQSDPVRGVGTALFAVTREAAVRAGMTTIDATIRADNRPGLSYYSKMGFEDHHVHKGVPLRDGTPVDRVVKLLKLA